MTLGKCLSISYKQIMTKNVCTLEIFHDKDITFNTLNCMDTVNRLSQINYDCDFTSKYVNS